MTSDNISGKQAVLLLLVCHSFQLMNFIPAFNRVDDPTARMYSAILSILFHLALFIPGILLYRRFPGQNVITVAWNRWKPLGRLYAGAYALVMIIHAAGTTAAFQYFLTNTVYPNANVTFIALSILVCGFACIKSRFEGIARAGSLIFWFLLISLLFICIVSLPSVNLFNVRPILDDPAQSIWDSVLVDTSQYTELLCLLLLFPKIKSSKGKCVFWLIVSCGIIAAVMNFFILSVMGEFSKTQTFPYYTLASISETRLLQRLDSLHMMIWTFTAFLRITLLLILASYCLKLLLPAKLHKSANPIIFLLVASLSVFAGNSVQILQLGNQNNGSIIITLLVGLPLFLLFITKRKGKEKHEVETDIPVTIDPE